MTLPTSGPISIGNVSTEILSQSTATNSLNTPQTRTLLGKPTGTVSLKDAYGKAYFSDVFEILIIAGGGGGGRSGDDGGGGGGAGRGNAGNAGNAGNPGTAAPPPATYNCVAVTPGASYPIVVGAGTQVVISWNAQ